MMTIQDAVRAIHQRQCVVFPTETVYGLGANALDPQSVENIFRLKNRPSSNPLIVHVPDIDSAYTVASDITPLEIKLLQKFSPGALSLILPKKSNVPDIVTGGLNSVGVRIPDHPIALEFLREVKVPIAAPSANISGKPSPTTYEMARFYMEDKGVVILDGGDLDIGIESTVIKVDYPNIYLLRAGAITPQMIAEVTGIMPTLNPQEAHHSPGTRFAHYKPNASVIVFTGTPPKLENSVLLCLNPNLNDGIYSRIYHFNDVKEYTHHLYEIFFQCDKQGITHIICELPPNVGDSMGLYDRLVRASTS